MKKTTIFLICAVLLSSCSVGPAVTSTPAPTSTNPPTEIPSATPTFFTPTYTNTPTLVGLKTATLTPEFTSTVVSATPEVLFTPNTPLPTVEMKGFVSIAVSGTEFYKPSGCEPVSVKVTAQVGDPGVAFVVLFVRFKSKQSGATSEWTSIAMQNIGAGTFVHDLISEEMKGDASFKNAWVQYQLVATTNKTREVGRTDIFSERLTLLDCEPPTPTPTLTPTPTMMKP